MDRRLAVVAAVAVLAVGVAGGAMVLGVFDGQADDPGSNQSTDGDDTTRSVELATGDDGRFRFLSSEEPRITGTSNLPEGTNLTYRVTSTGAQPWLETESVEVRENGTFGATVDLSSATPTESFEVTVVDAENDTRLANATGIVVASEYASRNPDVALGPMDGGVIRIDAAANQSLLGTTDLPPGTELRFVARSTGTEPFLKEFETTVGEDDGFSGTLDFGDVDANTSFVGTLSYAENGTDIFDVPGVAQQPGLADD